MAISPLNDNWSTERIAVLDMDGTLIRATLGTELLTDLLARGHCDATLTRRVFELVSAAQTGQLPQSSPSEALVKAVYQTCRDAIADTTTDELASTAAYTWSRLAPYRFDFVPDLLRLLRARGYRILLISGSPHEIVTIAATDLGVDAWCGAALSKEDSRGFLPAVPGGKREALNSLIEGHTVNLTQSFAVGNSGFDADILAMVGQPLVFEPDAPLLSRARQRGWPVADQYNILEICEDLTFYQ